MLKVSNVTVFTEDFKLTKRIYCYIRAFRVIILALNETALITVKYVDVPKRKDFVFNSEYLAAYYVILNSFILKIVFIFNLTNVLIVIKYY